MLLSIEEFVYCQLTLFTLSYKGLRKKFSEGLGTIIFKTLYFGLLIFILSMTASPVRAEPSPAVQWLMNEPASVFDIGMMRLEQKLKGYNKLLSKNAGGDTMIVLWYLWKKNQLAIRIYYTGITPPLLIVKNASTVSAYFGIL